jgi:preprotein translocase subunit Sec61beta
VTLAVTLILLAASLAAAGLLTWLERRPAELGKVRLLPTTPLIFLSILVAVVMLVHLANLMGVHTGNRSF